MPKLIFPNYADLTGKYRPDDIFDMEIEYDYDGDRDVIIERVTDIDTDTDVTELFENDEEVYRIAADHMDEYYPDEPDPDDAYDSRHDW